MMNAKYLVVGAAALAFAPSLASAQAVPPGQGYINGNNYWHLNSGNAFGQPSQSCQDINGGNTGPFYPRNTSKAPGTAFNETNRIAGPRYPGKFPPTQRNPASPPNNVATCS